MTAKVSQIHLEPFAACHQSGVEKLVLPIQQQEFGVSITREDQPDLMDVAGFFQKGNGNFWVALSGQEVVGSIGLVDIGNRQVALRKMFVASKHRGREKRVAQALLDQSLAWCRQKNIAGIFLGTTDMYHAAHRFYEKNGFEIIAKDKLPEAFPFCHVDTRFYCLNL